ncbi:MAG: hypothetical protein ACKO2X_06720, partial [Bacteroidota bacterium]
LRAFYFWAFVPKRGMRFFGSEWNSTAGYFPALHSVFWRAWHPPWRFSDLGAAHGTSWLCRGQAWVHAKKQTMERKWFGTRCGA